ncbi:MAG: Mg-chelatase subunit ChlD, partial [Cyanobacteria bacterium J06628_6]
MRSQMRSHPNPTRFLAVLTTLLLAGCGGGGGIGDLGGGSSHRGFEVKLLVGSALGHFCEDAAEQFNATNPTLA